MTLLQILRLFDKRWNDMWNEVHAAAFCLDPEYNYMDHKANDDAYEGLLKMIGHVHGKDSPEAAKAVEQFGKFKNREGIFAWDMIWKAAKTMRGGEWWLQNGGCVKELQQVAVRVLSAPVSSSAGERNWSTYGFIISDLRTRLTSERAEKLVYVHMNSRATKKVKKLDYVSEAFEWDEPSLAWLAEEFEWKGVENDEDEVRCDDDGQRAETVAV